MLLVLPVLQEAQRPRLAPPPLSARLAKPAPAEPVAPNAEPPAPPVVRPRLEPIAKAVPPPVQAPATAERVQSVDLPKPAPSAEIISAVPVTPVPPPPAPKQPQIAAGPDAGTVAQFRLELMDLARRYKKYPRIAQENNWEGRVELRIAIGEDGSLASITVKKSAGRTVLDDEAQAMLRNAKSRTTIPPALRGKAFALEIPVDFSLKD